MYNYIFVILILLPLHYYMSCYFQTANLHRILHPVILLRHAANINIHYLPVYHERFLTLGNTLVAPAQKAMTSVIDVIVIAIPLVLIVCPIRVSTSSLLEVPASPDKSTNMSSTPIPKYRNKSVKCWHQRTNISSQSRSGIRETKMITSKLPKKYLRSNDKLIHKKKQDSDHAFEMTICIASFTEARCQSQCVNVRAMSQCRIYQCHAITFNNLHHLDRNYQKHHSPLQDKNYRHVKLHIKRKF